MSKSFRIARKPGQVAESVGTNPAPSLPIEKKKRDAKTPLPAMNEGPKVDPGQSTRKTIEIPEDYFYRVKMRALERKMLEKELWAEIVGDYFRNHPVP